MKGKHVLYDHAIQLLYPVLSCEKSVHYVIKANDSITLNWPFPKFCDNWFHADNQNIFCMTLTWTQPSELQVHTIQLACR